MLTQSLQVHVRDGDEGVVDPGHEFSPVVAGQAAYDFAVAPESMTLDRIGVFQLTPNGNPDGVFTATVQGPITSIMLHSVDANGNTAGSQFWDTRAGDATWFLGVEEDGVLVNNADSSIPEVSAGVHRLKLYATSSGYFGSGYHFRLALTLPDGSTLRSPVLTY
ncbi:MAG: hypothetical protein ACKVPX_09930 [Myxococcaceae bacterium]